MGLTSVWMRSTTESFFLKFLLPSVPLLKRWPLSAALCLSCSENTNPGPGSRKNLRKGGGRGVEMCRCDSLRHKARRGPSSSGHPVMADTGTGGGHSLTAAQPLCIRLAGSSSPSPLALGLLLPPLLSPAKLPQPFLPLSGRLQLLLLMPRPPALTRPHPLVFDRRRVGAGSTGKLMRGCGRWRGRVPARPLPLGPEDSILIPAEGGYGNRCLARYIILFTEDRYIHDCTAATHWLVAEQNISSKCRLWPHPLTGEGGTCPSQWSTVFLPGK